MKTLRFLGMALFAVLVCVNFASCGGSDDENAESSVNWNPYFWFDGNSSKYVQSGAEYHYTDDLREHDIRISADKNIEADKRTEFLRHDIYFDTEGPINIIRENPDGVLIKFERPGTGKLIAHDYTDNRRYFINIVIDEADLKNNVKIYQKQDDGWFDENRVFHDGPFLRIKTTEKLTNFGTSGRFKIKSFGSNKAVHEPSQLDKKWATATKENSNGTYSYDGDYYMGKVNISNNNVEYWFYQFTYGSKQHEVRQYIGSDKCLWDGEWDN